MPKLLSVLVSIVIACGAFGSTGCVIKTGSTSQGVQKGKHRHQHCHARGKKHKKKQCHSHPHTHPHH